MIVLAATAQAAGEDYTTIPEALVNTVIAMGTVFLVLILISFIISLLKYIPALMDKFTKRRTGTTNSTGTAGTGTKACCTDTGSTC